jgi:hypothetical protein
MIASPVRPASHRIVSVSIIGGFLDGLRFDFLPGLNCFIGARGSGKTTMVELIRYALDALPMPWHERLDLARQLADSSPASASPRQWTALMRLATDLPKVGHRTRHGPTWATCGKRGGRD